MDSIKVIITNRQKEVKIPTGIRLLIRRCCHAVLETENFESSAEVSVSFINDEQIRQLNSEFRNKDIPTDVLSFPLGENGVYDINPATGAKQLGDIVISMQRAVEQSVMYGHSLQPVSYTHLLIRALSGSSPCSGSRGTDGFTMSPRRCNPPAFCRMAYGRRR